MRFQQGVDDSPTRSPISAEELANVLPNAMFEEVPGTLDHLGGNAALDREVHQCAL